MQGESREKIAACHDNDLDPGMPWLLVVKQRREKHGHCKGSMGLALHMGYTLNSKIKSKSYLSGKRFRARTATTSCAAFIATFP